MKAIFPGTAVLLVAATCAYAPAPPPRQAAPAPDGELPLTHAPRPTTGAITPADLMTRLYVLADDSMMGRQAGTRGNAMATDYVAGEFRRLGLAPAGEDGTYFQTIPLVTRRLEPGATLRAGGEPLAQGTDWIPLQVVPGAPPPARELQAGGIPVVFGGRLGGEMVGGEKARGRAVVLLPPLGADGRPDYRFWTAWPGDRFRDAAAVLVASLEISPPGVASYFSTEQVDLGETGPAQAATPAVLLVSGAAAERLLGAALPNLRPGVPGGALHGAFRFADHPAAVPARNVVAVLPGSDPALRGEYVAISAHNDHEGVADRAVDHDSLLAYNLVMRPAGANDPRGDPTPQQWARIAAVRDSLGALRPARLDSVYNGADDDGSGTVTLLEIAESLARSGTRPRRSVLFISHTAEEAGLLGSRHFSDHPTVPRDSIVALLNMDMVGHGRAWEVEGGGPRYLQIIGSRRLST
ncbi:MAG TPA: M20/M25/M40 family metallo-hydrolase, partial [Longimicrobiaceae bacterium]|nr:M20/M25/M40 family metallo-hydrolase [Longimicrobiaceae bacterium]